MKLLSYQSKRRRDEGSFTALPRCFFCSPAGFLCELLCNLILKCQRRRSRWRRKNRPSSSHGPQLQQRAALPVRINEFSPSAPRQLYLLHFVHRRQKQANIRFKLASAQARECGGVGGKSQDLIDRLTSTYSSDLCHLSPTFRILSIWLYSHNLRSSGQAEQSLT